MILLLFCSSLLVVTFGAACKEKWKNLRCAYTRYLRQKPPSGASAQAKKKYYLADCLAFLTPFTKSRKQKGSIPSPMNITEETSFSTTYEETTETQPPESELQPLESELQDGNHENNEEKRDEQRQSDHSAPRRTVVEESATNEFLLIPESSSTRNKVSRTKRKEIDPLEKCAIDYFNSKKRCQVETTEDADFLFLKSLLPDLRQMTNAQKHEFKWKTLQNIGEILYKPPLNNMVPTNSQYTNYNSSHSSFRSHSALSNNCQPQSMQSSSHISTPLTSPSTSINDYDFLQTL